MPSHRFSVDCKQEQARFLDMLKLTSTERVLAIHADGMRGKTHFLERLSRICHDQEPVVPSSLVDFAVLREGDPLGLVRAIRKGFGRFVRFERLDRLMTDYDMRVWNPSVGSIAGQVVATDARFDGARDFVMAGLHAGPQSHVTVNGGPQIALVEERALLAAQEQCLQAFFEELTLHCQHDAAVVIVDTYEQGPEVVRQWFETELHDRCVAGEWPERLLLVVAGRQIPAFADRWPERHYRQRVIVLDNFGRWEPEDIADGFRDVGFAEPPGEYADIVAWMQRGAEPGLLVGLMELATRRGDR
jgi:hypothetical protein